MDQDEFIGQLINPYYAINIDPDLATKHEPLVDQEQWIQANRKLIDEIGAHEWLRRLLDVLRGDYPRSPENTDLGED